MYFSIKCLLNLTNIFITPLNSYKTHKIIKNNIYNKNKKIHEVKKQQSDLIKKRYDLIKIKEKLGVCFDECQLALSDLPDLYDKVLLYKYKMNKFYSIHKQYFCLKDEYNKLLEKKHALNKTYHEIQDHQTQIDKLWLAIEDIKFFCNKKQKHIDLIKLGQEHMQTQLLEERKTLYLKISITENMKTSLMKEQSHIAEVRCDVRKRYDCYLEKIKINKKKYDDILLKADFIQNKEILSQKCEALNASRSKNILNRQKYNAKLKGFSESEIVLKQHQLLLEKKQAEINDVQFKMKLMEFTVEINNVDKLSIDWNVKNDVHVKVIDDMLQYKTKHNKKIDEFNMKQVVLQEYIKTCNVVKKTLHDQYRIYITICDMYTKKCNLYNIDCSIFNSFLKIFQNLNSYYSLELSELYDDIIKNKHVYTTYFTILNEYSAAYNIFASKQYEYVKYSKIYKILKNKLNIKRNHIIVQKLKYNIKI